MLSKNVLLIQESNQPLLKSSGDGNESFFLSGLATQWDVPNNNRRIYTKEGFAPHIDNLNQQRQEAGVVFGEYDHPDKFDTSLTRVSHEIKDLTYDDKAAYIKIRLLNNFWGKEARALAEDNVPLFISSRCAGEVMNSGVVKINKLFTYDLVAVPGFSSAKLNRLQENVLNESLNYSMSENFRIYDLSENKSISDLMEKNANQYVTANQLEEFKAVLESKVDTIGQQMLQHKKVENMTALKEQLDHLMESISNIEAFCEKAASAHNRLEKDYKHFISHYNENTKAINENLTGVEKTFEPLYKVVNEHAEYKAQLDRTMEQLEMVTECANNTVNYADSLATVLDTVITETDSINAKIGVKKSFTKKYKAIMESTLFSDVMSNYEMAAQEADVSLEDEGGEVMDTTDMEMDTDMETTDLAGDSELEDNKELITEKDEEKDAKKDKKSDDKKEDKKSDKKEAKADKKDDAKEDTDEDTEGEMSDEAEGDEDEGDEDEGEESDMEDEDLDDMDMASFFDMDDEDGDGEGEGGKDDVDTLGGDLDAPEQDIEAQVDQIADAVNSIQSDVASLKGDVDTIKAHTGVEGDADMADQSLDIASDPGEGMDDKMDIAADGEMDEFVDDEELNEIMEPGSMVQERGTYRVGRVIAVNENRVKVKFARQDQPQVCDRRNLQTVSTTKSLQEQVSALIAAANQPKAEVKKTPAYIEFLNESQRKFIEELPQAQLHKVQQTLNESAYFSGTDVMRIVNDVLIADQPDNFNDRMLAHMPSGMRPLWEKLSVTEQENTLNSARHYRTDSDVAIVNFWRNQMLGQRPLTESRTVFTKQEGASPLSKGEIDSILEFMSK